MFHPKTDLEKYLSGRDKKKLPLIFVKIISRV